MDKATFERHYSDLDACFAAVLGDIYDEFFARAQEAVAGQSGWRDRMRATAYAMLRFLRRDERVARLAAVEVQYAGKRAQELFLETFNRLVKLLDSGLRKSRRAGVARSRHGDRRRRGRLRPRPGGRGEGRTGPGRGGDPRADVRRGLPLPRRRGG